jgi:hypothetical protein
MASTKNRNNN